MNPLNKEVADGHEALNLLENPVYQRSIEQVRDGIVKSMQDSPMGDERTHNKLVMCLQLLHQIDKNIRTVADTGKLARIQLDKSIGQKIRSVVR